MGRPHRAKVGALATVGRTSTDVSVTSVADRTSKLNTQAVVADGRLYVKVHPEIGRVAVLQGLSLPFRIWTILRTIDGDGRGVVGHDAAMRALWFYGMDRWHVRRAIKAQDAAGVVFFSISPRKFTYTSITNVSTQLGVTRAVAPVLMPTGNLRKLSAFNAGVYAAWVGVTGGADGLMMSRAKLGELWGVSDQQLRKWEKAAGVRVTHNVVDLGTQWLDPDSVRESDVDKAVPRDGRLDERLDQRYVFTKVDEAGNERRFYQTVNRYNFSGLTCPMGQTRKAAKAARAPQSEAAENVPAARRQRRVFFRAAFLQRRDWQWSLTGTSLSETDETITGQRKYRGRGADVVLSRRHNLAVWRFNAMTPKHKASVL